MSTEATISIVPAREIDSTLAMELREWFEAEFGSADRWAAPHYYLMLDLHRMPAGRLGILDTRVRVENEIVRVGGIGGVATRRDFRHRGLASRMLSRAAGFMRDELQVDFGLLLCRHEVSPVYAKAGWSIVPGPTTFIRSGVSATYPNDTMILPLANKTWPPGLIDMMGLPW